MKDLLLCVHTVVKTVNLEISPYRRVPHVQHDYFASFNQSDHCFLGLSLSLPSTLLKLSNDEGDGNEDVTTLHS